MGGGGKGGGGGVFYPVDATLISGLTFLEQQSAILSPFFFSKTSSFLTLVLPTFFFFFFFGFCKGSHQTPSSAWIRLAQSLERTCGLSFSLSADHCRVFSGPGHSGYSSANAKKITLCLPLDIIWQLQ